MHKQRSIMILLYFFSNLYRIDMFFLLPQINLVQNQIISFHSSSHKTKSKLFVLSNTSCSKSLFDDSLLVKMYLLHSHSKSSGSSSTLSSIFLRNSSNVLWQINSHIGKVSVHSNVLLQNTCLIVFCNGNSICDRLIHWFVCIYQRNE